MMERKYSINMRLQYTVEFRVMQVAASTKGCIGGDPVEQLKVTWRLQQPQLLVLIARDQ
jgi:hypothetical protein